MVKPHKLWGYSSCVLQGLDLNQLIEDVIFKGTFTQNGTFVLLCIIYTVEFFAHHQTVLKDPFIFKIALTSTDQLTGGIIGVHH